MAYDFHYTPTGTGVISGKEVLEQTEDAINDLGNTAISGVQEALDKAEQALTNSANAVDDAQTALNTANNAEGVAIQAQTDVGNLSGTVTNIGNRVTTAESNIGNLQGRMTTAESNIGNLQGRMTTAETNIGNLQTAVSTAQATANSAQQTATTARQQSYVFRYSGTAVVPNSTITYSTIDNTDNIKSGDKILDVDGKLFEITAVDTTNQTVTVGTALIDLALDANVVHTSGDETVDGVKTFSSGAQIYNANSSNNTPSMFLRTSKVSRGSTTDGSDNISLMFNDSGNSLLSSVRCTKLSNGTTQLRNIVVTTDTSNNIITYETQLSISKNGDKSFIPSEDNNVSLGKSGNRWKDVQTYQINGLTPSSLSLPSDRSARVDISGYITNLGNGDNNTYTVPANGYVWLHFTSINNALCFSQTSGGLTNYAQTFSRYSGDGILYAFFPVRKDDYFIVQIYTSSTAVVQNAYFIPCQGNI